MITIHKMNSKKEMPRSAFLRDLYMIMRMFRECRRFVYDCVRAARAAPCSAVAAPHYADTNTLKLDMRCLTCIISSYPNEGDEVDDLESDDEEVFDVNEGDSVQGKHPTDAAPADAGSENAAARPSASTPNATAEDYRGDAYDDRMHSSDHEALPPLPEEEPELIGTPKAPKVELSHDAPLHANCQSLFKSLRGWLFGDDSDDESKQSGDNAYSSEQLRSKDAVLAHALRIQGWKNHAEHFTGAASTGNQDHLDQPNKCVACSDVVYFAREYVHACCSYVLVDAHVISTPVIGDIDGDGDADVRARWNCQFRHCSSPFRLCLLCRTSSTRTTTKTLKRTLRSLPTFNSTTTSLAGLLPTTFARVQCCGKFTWT
jgi:hypothetical protein